MESLTQKSLIPKFYYRLKAGAYYTFIVKKNMFESVYTFTLVHAYNILDRNSNNNYVKWILMLEIVDAKFLCKNLANIQKKI